MEYRIFNPFSNFSGWVSYTPDGSAYKVLQGGLVSRYPVSPLLLRRRYSFEEEE